MNSNSSKVVLKNSPTNKSLVTQGSVNIKVKIKATFIFLRS
jgi:hypothetical protein